MNVVAPVSADQRHASLVGDQLVTFRIDNQSFGIAALKVRDVLRQQPLTRVPLAPAGVSGAINLRGHIVTAIDVRTRLGVTTDRPERPPMCIVVDIKGEPICLMVDSVGDVMTIDPDQVEPNPGSLQASWAAMSRGVHRLPESLLLMLDVDQLATL